MWTNELEVAKECVVLAGYEIMKIYQDEELFNVEYKTNNTPLTAADKASNKAIIEILHSEFPEYAILSEEEQDNLERLNNDFCFVVDPLDGTKEFIKRNGQFTVNIALSYKHHSEMGVIFVPATGELYFASKGNGSYLIEDGYKWFKNNKIANIRRLSVSNRAADLRCVMSSSHGCAQMDALINDNDITNIIKIGSSLKGCLIAKGDAEIYYRFNPTMEWDTAAMQCIVEEAGGFLRQIDNSDMTYNREDSCNRKGFYIINIEENQLLN
ncbi:MAG: 3'(2'),5'-bisphosphate nucleotidase CysQ [Lachnospiraceae bacterium]|nr:3'(2'),5'-bisphosphate nucleotidase CysQ [Lachnospiraceae bacterium]